MKIHFLGGTFDGISLIQTILIRETQYFVQVKILSIKINIILLFLCKTVIWETSWSVISIIKTSTTQIFTAAMPKPNDAWLGFFIELEFNSIEDSNLSVSTEVSFTLLVCL